MKTQAWIIEWRNANVDAWHRYLVMYQTKTQARNAISYMKSNGGHEGYKFRIAKYVRVEEKR